MLETALDIPSAKRKESADAQIRPRQSKTGLYSYFLLAAAVLAGWILSDVELVDPAEGVGYWLGIVGGSLMLLLLFYPVGKKSALMRRLGLVKHWFRVHMVLGLIGPLLVLYHCNFSVDAMNSRVALYSMLAVALSGIIGKHFYARIHRGLYGKRVSIEDLRSEITSALENNRGLAAILPGFINELHALANEMLGDRFTRTISLRNSLSWTLRYYVIRARLRLTIRKELQARAMVSEPVKANLGQLRKNANAYAAKQVGLMRQVAQIAFYERLFSLWHVFHLPLFVLLVASALVHVLAVHMY